MSRHPSIRRRAAAHVACGLVLWTGVLSCGREPTRGGEPIPPEVARLATFVTNDATRDLRLMPEDDVEGRLPPVQQVWLGEGWRSPTPVGTWAVGRRSTLELYLAGPTDATFRFEARPHDVETVDVLVNGVFVSTVPLAAEWRDYTVAVSAGALRAGRNDITLEFPREEPVPAGEDVADARRFALGLLEERPATRTNLLALLPRIRQQYPNATIVDGDRLNLPGMVVADVIPGNSAGAGRWQWNDSPGSLAVLFRRVGLVSESGVDVPSLLATEGGWRVQTSGTAVIPFGLDRPVATLRLSGELSASEGVARVVPTVHTVHGEPIRGDAAALEDGERLHVELPMSEVGSVGCLLLDVAFDGPTVDRQLDLEVRTTPVPGAASGATSAGSVGPSRPDIVVIVLDAARADHVGAHGYRRDTTPHIDRLAHESLVFDRAFAVAPYTLASMPTMLSGLSFLDHGVVEHGHALAEEVTTLAEALRGVGYRTTCISGNPNNSSRVGLAQGCDAFIELWRGATLEDAVDPHRLAAVALDRWSGRGDAPEFMMLHFVPPHDPYRPSPDFDVFGDASYAGGYDGSIETLRAVDQGAVVPGVEDVEEIVSLYDGNLRMADDAVGQVLEGLRASRRWDDTVVLVVSDHGEAFGEHGRFLHNSTLYDEMLRVPFVLRVPEARRPADVQTTSLVSLADIVPTLLGLAAIEPPAGQSGRDLLARSHARTGVLARAASRPLFAFRTGTRKVVWSWRRRVQLFDLAADPLERVDVAAERFGEVQCLTSLARWELERPRSFRPRDGSSLSEDDERTLRSLGYVR